MTSRPPAPPLPKPQHPAVAAKALAEAAYAAAHAWAQPLEPDRHNRAISQLYSTLRDLGIAARGLARYQTADASPDPASRDFAAARDRKRPVAAQRVREPRRRAGSRGHSARCPTRTNPARPCAGQPAT